MFPVSHGRWESWGSGMAGFLFYFERGKYSWDLAGMGEDVPIAVHIPSTLPPTQQTFLFSSRLDLYL